MGKNPDAHTSTRPTRISRHVDGAGSEVIRMPLCSAAPIEPNAQEIYRHPSQPRKKRAGIVFYPIHPSTRSSISLKAHKSTHHARKSLPPPSPGSFLESLPSTPRCQGGAEEERIISPLSCQTSCASACPPGLRASETLFRGARCLRRRAGGGRGGSGQLTGF